MKSLSYLNSMDISPLFRRCIYFFLIVVTCLCTAMRCKDNYLFEELLGLEAASIHVVLSPQKDNYKIGDTISITGVITPDDLNLEDFSTLAYFDLPANYMLYDEWGEKIDHGAFSLLFGEEYYREGFDKDKSKYMFKVSLRLEKSGVYRIQKEKKILTNRKDGTVFYSTLNITLSSGVRKPHGYRTDIPMYFTNNDKTYFAINVNN